MDDSALGLPLLNSGNTEPEQKQIGDAVSNQHPHTVVEVVQEVILPVCVLSLGVGVSCAALWVSVAHVLSSR